MTIFAPAKINLFLIITEKRNDGFHEIISLMTCIDLFDILLVEEIQSGIEIKCDHPGVPCNKDNLVFKAAELFYQTLGVQGGLCIDIQKKIPIGAGLGGGSSDAAAILHYLNQKYEFPFTTEKLMKMSLIIGADIPFFIYKNPAIVTGIGEKITPFKSLQNFYCVVIYPNIIISTREIYKNFNLRLTNPSKKIIEGFLKDGVFDAKKHLVNDLEKVAIPRHPMMKEIKEALINSGAEGALMSGSGSVIFGLFTDNNVAENVAKSLATNKGWEVFKTKLL